MQEIGYPLGRRETIAARRSSRLSIAHRSLFDVFLQNTLARLLTDRQREEARHRLEACESARIISKSYRVHHATVRGAVPQMAKPRMPVTRVRGQDIRT